MAKFNIPKEELLELAHQMIQLRTVMSRDHLHMIFSEVSILDYSLILQTWPNLKIDMDSPCEPIYLQTMSEQSQTPMNQISKMVKNLSDKGLILWERGETGTYIELSKHGREKMQLQRQILAEYFDRVITRIGEQRFKELIKDLSDVEQIMEESIQI